MPKIMADRNTETPKKMCRHAGLSQKLGLGVRSRQGGDPQKNRLILICIDMEGRCGGSIVAVVRRVVFSWFVLAMPCSQLASRGITLR